MKIIIKFGPLALTIIFLALHITMRTKSFGIITAFSFMFFLPYWFLYLLGGAAFTDTKNRTTGDWCRFWINTLFFMASAFFFRDSYDSGANFGIVNIGPGWVGVCMASMIISSALSIAALVTYKSRKKKRN